MRTDQLSIGAVLTGVETVTHKDTRRFAPPEKARLIYSFENLFILVILFTFLLVAYLFMVVVLPYGRMLRGGSESVMIKQRLKPTVVYHRYGSEAEVIEYYNSGETELVSEW